MKKINVKVGDSGYDFLFYPNEEMMEIQFGKKFAEDNKYGISWSVGMTEDERLGLGVESGILTKDYQPNIEVQDDINLRHEARVALDDLAYKETKKRFIIGFRNDWAKVISKMGEVELIFPEGYGKEIIKA
ncbi:hypothetical protein [Peptostreptococcus sp.]